MPIKGLTDRGVAFPQIGSIRKGGKKRQIIDKQTGKGKVNERGEPIMMQGEDLPYFRLDFDERETGAIKKFNQLYPDGKPTAITIVLPFDQIERVWNPWREAYSAGALLHRCDSEYVNYAINPQTGEIVVRNGLDVDGHPVKCALVNDPDRRKRCKPTGRLSVIIPELERMAYLVVHTTSIHDIGNISDQLAAIRDLNGGHIAGIPLILRRRPVKISTPSGDNGKRIRREKHLINIEADPEWVARKIAAMKIAIMPAQEIKQIVAPITGPEWSENDDDEDEDDPIIEAEPLPISDLPVDVDDSLAHIDKPLPEPKKTYRIASVKFNGMTHDEWHARATAFAQANPNWLNKQGNPDMNHILASAGHAGYEFITGENIDEVFTVIVAAHEIKRMQP